MNRATYIGIVVAALGYFVDVYDLILFNVVRVPSLKDLGLSGDELLNEGLFLLNVQMVGLLLGGILWGVLGDKRGRISVLFGSIVLYSVANIANGFVNSIEAYAFWRFLAGIGLAGELGAGVTLVSEMMPKEKRGYGTTIIASVGVMGALVAAVVGDNFNWRVAYWVGGGMGLLLLALRVVMHESGLFHSVSSKNVSRGNFFMLFTSRDRFQRYIFSVLVGLPVWYLLAVLVGLAPEYGKEFEMAFLPSASGAIFYFYVGLVAGDLSSGLLSQYLRSRKKVLGLFLLITAVFTYTFLTLRSPSLFEFYSVCLALGVGGGFWAVFVTSATEQFGTNLRATVTTTAPNFVRGSTVLVTQLFLYLKPSLGITSSAFAVGVLCLLVAFYSLSRLEETFGRDLDFVER